MRRIHTLLSQEILVIFLIVLGALSIRSLHYSEVVNFSTDQATFATESLEIWENKEVRLIGPSISMKTMGRELFQGSITYYFQLLFLLPAQFDPIVASYLFTLFASFMIIPLYLGSRLLLGKNGALILTGIYAFTPLYVDYTRFLWNPTFQLSLTPFLVLWMGLFAKYRKWYLFAFIPMWCGVLLQFHYQYVIVTGVLFLYYVVIKKSGWKSGALFFASFCVGYSPMILFELRNQFYNLQTLWLYITHWGSMFSKGVGSSFQYYYFISIGIVGLLPMLHVLRKWISQKNSILFVMILGIFALVIYVPRPNHATGMVENWNVLYEKKAHEIILEQNLSNYNIINLGYDTVAMTQKYFMKKEGVKENWEDYYRNKHLFIIVRKGYDYMKDPAYEINTFLPSRVIKKWDLNDMFELILRERVDSKK